MRFSGMEGCSTKTGIYHGVRSSFEQCSGHFVYIHYRNHWPALCFTHLIPKYDDFVRFDSLLLNLYLLLKNSIFKSNICYTDICIRIKSSDNTMAKQRKSCRESTWSLRSLSCLAWCNIFENERAGSKVIYYFVIKLDMLVKNFCDCLKKDF